MDRYEAGLRVCGADRSPRSAEVFGATWAEIDVDAATWTIPPGRMKGKREHRVPLSGRALEILVEARELDNGTGLIFPSARGRKLSRVSFHNLLKRAEIHATAHGFRSSFRDWVAEETDHPREVVEAALAHVVRNKVEAAYNRTDLFERRHRLMQEWATYLAGDRS